jgi:hypothetical protein
LQRAELEMRRKPLPKDRYPLGYKARYSADGSRTEKPIIRALIRSVDLVRTLW